MSREGRKRMNLRMFCVVCLVMFLAGMSEGYCIKSSVRYPLSDKLLCPLHSCDTYEDCSCSSYYYIPPCWKLHHGWNVTGYIITILLLALSEGNVVFLVHIINIYQFRELSRPAFPQ